jgi:hypothetical protein
MPELHDITSPIFRGGSSPAIAETDYVQPGGVPSAAGRHVTVDRGDGHMTYGSSPSMMTEHLASNDLRVPTTGQGFASTRGAESAAAYLKGSDNYSSPYDTPNSIIPPETKIQAAVDPGIRALESSYGLNKGKKGPKI